MKKMTGSSIYSGLQSLDPPADLRICGLEVGQVLEHGDVSVYFVGHNTALICVANGIVHHFIVEAIRWIF